MQLLSKHTLGYVRGSDTPTPSSAKLPLQHLEHRRRVAVIGLELDRHPQ